MKLQELNQFLDRIDEMANLSSRDHGIPNIKISIRQPGKDRYTHDVSIKIFSKDIKEAFLVVINRNTGGLTVQNNTVLHGVSQKIVKKAIHFVQINYINIVKLWDDQSLAIDDLNWIKE